MAKCQEMRFVRNLQEVVTCDHHIPFEIFRVSCVRVVYIRRDRRTNSCGSQIRKYVMDDYTELSEYEDEKNYPEAKESTQTP